MPHAVCPACDKETYVSVRLQEGDLVRCRNCREQLEVVDTDPYELDWPYDDEADDLTWEDDDQPAPRRASHGWDDDEVEDALWEEEQEGDDDEDESYDASWDEDEMPAARRR
jgi:hypothetical protein